MSEAGKQNLPLLTEESWTLWRTIMHGILYADDLYDIVTGQERAANDATAQQLAEFRKKEKKALKIILPTISKDLVQYLPVPPTDPKAVWDSLVSHFESASSLNVYSLKLKLFRMALTEKENPIPWIRKRMEIYGQLRQLGKDIEEKDQVTETLGMLPPTFYESVITSLMTQLPTRDMSMMEVSEYLDNFWKNKTGFHGNSKGNTESAYTTDYAGTNSSRRGRGRGRGGSRGGRGAVQGRACQSSIKCYGCGGTGHVKRDCPSVKEKKEQKDRSKIGSMFFALSSNAQSANFCTNPEEVLLDSGASSHMSCRRDCFTDYKQLESPMAILAAGNNAIQAVGIGTLNINIKYQDGNVRTCTMANCLHVPDLNFTLFSCDAALSNNRKITLKKQIAKIVEGGNVIATATKRGAFYYLDCDLKVTSNHNVKGSNDAHRKNSVHETYECNNGNFRAADESVFSLNGRTTANIWHQRFGHLGENNLRKLIDSDMVLNLDCSTKELDFCESCAIGKACSLPFPRHSESRATEVLELLHTDVIGPMQTPSIGGAKYIVTFIDDMSRFVWVRFITHKSEVLKKFKALVQQLETATGKKLKTLRSDCGGEYVSKEFEEFLEEKGILHQKSVPYCPEQNGVAERMGRTLVEKARAMLKGAGLSNEFWAEAVANAAYVRNRSPTSSLENITPFEAWWNKKPSVKHLRIFGCKAYSHIPNKFRQKLDNRVVKCIFLGYSTCSKAYRLWSLDKRSLLIRRNVIFDESSFGTDETKAEQLTDESTVNGVEVSDCTGQGNENTSIDEHEEEVIPVRRTERVNAGQPPERYGEWEFNCKAAYAVNPLNWKEAMTSNESENWREAGEREYQSLIDHDTWDLVPLPRGKKLIGSRMVFRVKYDEHGQIERYKARLVAQGYSQEYGKDYLQVFSPVIRWESVRTLISMAVQYGMELHQMDVDVSFLNGNLKEEIYMKQPDGFVVKGQENLVCKLKKSIYGLKQSPRCWNEALDEHLKKIGFIQSKADPCLYIGKIDGELIFLAVYVDDIILASKKPEVIQKTKKLFASKFEVKDMGRLHYFLGVRIVQNEGNVWIGQDRYLEEVLEKFGMQNAKSVATPMEQNAKPQQVTKDSELFDSKLYQSAIGSLMYLANVTRPDISYAVHKLAQYCNQPGTVHWSMVKRVLRYLCGTRKLGLLYQRTRDTSLYVFSDADFAGDLDTRKSTSGYTLLKNKGIVSWKSKKQSIVAQSTAEAEYVALYFAVQECIWIRQLLQDLKEPQNKASVVYEDNQAAIKISENPINHPKTKHIATKYHFTREQLESGQIALEFCPTEQMIADIMTKPLGRCRFETLRRGLGLTAEPGA